MPQSSQTTGSGTPTALGPPPHQLCPAAAPPGPRMAASPARPVASTPPHPPVSGPGASEADAGDGLRSWPAPSRSRTGRACMEGGLSTSRGLGRRWPIPRRTPGGSWGPAGGSGCLLPRGCPSRVLGCGELTLCCSLGDSTWVGPGPPHPQGGPCLPPMAPLQGWRAHHHSGISWGRSWCHPEGGTEVIVCWDRSLTTGRPGHRGPGQSPSAVGKLAFQSQLWLPCPEPPPTLASVSPSAPWSVGTMVQRPPSLPAGILGVMD